MDSHVFRIAGQALLEILDGARIEKIHGPARDTVVFTIFAQGEKRRLVLRWGQHKPFLFFSSNVPENPVRPPARIMRLRKYASGRRVGRGVLDFTQRCIVFPVLEGGSVVRFLLLDMRHGPEVLSSIPEGLGREPAWPDNETIDEYCNKEWNNREMEGAWQLFPVLTPLLRETLARLEPLEGRALLADLRESGQGLFVYQKDEVPCFYSAWPLPRELEKKRSLIFSHDTFEIEKGVNNAVLEAVSAVDEPAFFKELAAVTAKPEEKETARESKKLKRLLAKLDQEKRRLGDMLGLREEAILLQANLWRLPADERLAEILLPIEGEEKGENTRRIVLNPLLSIRENMQRMFHQSDRGARGLLILEKRREGLMSEQFPEHKDFNRDESQSFSSESKVLEYIGDATELSGKDLPGGKKIKDVAVFRSSSGHIILRGKNAKGNSVLLKIGKPYDLWLHARGGPSAHAVIRKNNAAEELPVKTIEEAAVLVGQKSWQRNAGRAEIMTALVRHVYPIKGAAPGTVRVDEEQAGLMVDLPENIVQG